MRVVGVSPDSVGSHKKFKDKTSAAVPRVGDISRIKKFTGWKPKFSFYDMINELMRIEINENK